MDIVNIIKRLNDLQVFKYCPPRAVINMVGPDARDFLQRMSTNDMGPLVLGQHVQTCFLNNKGRIFDYVTVVPRELNNYALVSSFAQASHLLDWLERFHFVEDFTLSIAPDRCEWLIARRGQLENTLWRSRDFDFAMNVQTNDYPELDKTAWEFLRISALMPEESEVALALMPQNIGLGSLISESKGCYVGQEVVAKALTYQKHAKCLGGAKLDLETFMKARVGDRVKDSQGRSGVITSLAPLYMPEYIQALAVIDDKLEGDAYVAHLFFS